MTFLLIRYIPKVWLHVSVAILLFVFASCKSSSVASLQDAAHTSIVHDTIRLTNDASRIDSVFIYNNGDTVMIRQRTIERMVRDSIRIVYVNDSSRQHKGRFLRLRDRLHGFLDL